MQLSKVVRALILLTLLMCGYALADNNLETYNALGIGAMPCLGNPRVVVFSVYFAETQPDGNVIDWTNEWSSDVNHMEHIFFDPTLKEVNDSPKTYDLYYDSLRSFYYRSSYGKLDITGDVYIYFTQHEGDYYTDCSMLVDEVLEQCEEYIDWSQYDDNQDGYVDGIYIWPTSDPSWEMSDRMNFVSYAYENSVKDMKVSRCAYITAIQVGIARAKRLKNKVVVFGTMERGSFSKNDQVQIQQDRDTDSTVILEAYVCDCEENTIDVSLRANMGKHQLTAGERGWLVLNYERDVEIGRFIAG